MAMTPSTPHIVCFAPYTDWSIHSARQVNILHALSVRGATSTYVTCDGVFSDCDLFQEATGAVQGRRANSCLICQASVAARLAAWAGYVGTTGVAAMDWLIADSHHTPDGYERWASERIVRLPHDYICYRPPVEAPPVMDLPSDTAERVTFGCFNNLVKVNGDALALWAKVLAVVPGSRLILKCADLDQPNLRDWVRATMAGHGIDTERIDLRENHPMSNS